MSKTPPVPSRERITRKQYRVLDEDSRSKRHQEHIEQFERDNHQEDPHGNLVLHKKVPKFSDSSSDTQNVSPAPKRNYALFKTYPSLNTMIEDKDKADIGRFYRGLGSAENTPDKENPNNKQQNQNEIFDTVKFPFFKRHFCSVCGFKSNYTCISCGQRTCSSHCLQVHKDTRCLKWTG